MGVSGNLYLKRGSQKREEKDIEKLFSNKNYKGNRRRNALMGKIRKLEPIMVQSLDKEEDYLMYITKILHRF